METDSKKHALFALNIFTFLLTLHTTLPVYINSSYISNFLAEKSVGLVYTLASILTIIAIIFTNKLLRKFGNYKIVFWLLIFEVISLLGINYAGSTIPLVVLFCLNFITIGLLGFTTDIFLENLSSVASTGKTRGVFLTSANTAWIVSALITSFILTDGDYWKIYIASAILFIPIIFLVRVNFKNFKDQTYEKISYPQEIIKTLKNKNLRSIVFATFLLQFFYAWMTIYMPIYLHNHIGFNWTSIGIIFAIMLLPFIITEIPLGKLADNKWGEKEMLCVGFLIISLSTALISFIDAKNIIIWTAVLFVTRIGASVIEIMTETYFFKIVNPKDSGIVGIFRSARPLAYIVSPVIATILLSFLDIRYMFIGLGVILFLGAGASLVLEDTK